MGAEARATDARWKRKVEFFPVDWGEMNWHGHPEVGGGVFKSGTSLALEARFRGPRFFSQKTKGAGLRDRHVRNLCPNL